jgi:hypothetical protein
VQSSINVIGKQSTIGNEYYYTRVIRINVKGIAVDLLVRTGTFTGIMLDEKWTSFLTFSFLFV